MVFPLRIAVVVLPLAAAVCFADGQTYKAIGEYKTSSPAKGVAVDVDSRRIFVATSEGVSVLNADTGEFIGNVAGITNVQGVMLVPMMNGEEKAPSTIGFASDSMGHVVRFSLADLKVTATAKLETTGAAALCYDDYSQTVEAVSAGGSLTTINAASGKIEKAGKLGTGTGQIVCGTLAHVYVADPAANVVHVLNHQTMKNDGDLPMKTGHMPTGLALDTKGRRLFVGCEDGVIEVIDTDAGFTFIELKGGKGPAHETFTYLPQGKGQWKAAAFVSQQDGTLSGVRMNAFINYTIGGTYTLAPGLGSMAYDDKTHHLFIASTTSPTLMVVGY